MSSKKKYVVYTSEGFTNFTKDNIYEVIKDNGSYYTLKNDIGELSTPAKKHPYGYYFISLREYNLKKLLA